VVGWQYFPKSDEIPPLLAQVVAAFETSHPECDSATHQLSSNEVLAIVRPGLESLGFVIETGKTAAEKIHVPVLFGRNGRLEKYFEADGFHEDEGIVIEVEAGRGYANNQFLKDLFQACMMHDVRYLVIAVRLIYKSSQDFERVVSFIDTLYASQRLPLPLDGVLIVGY
jgi:hypothetical protein